MGTNAKRTLPHASFPCVRARKAHIRSARSRQHTHAKIVDPSITTRTMKNASHMLLLAVVAFAALACAVQAEEVPTFTPRRLAQFEFLTVFQEVGGEFVMQLMSSVSSAFGMA